MILNPETEFKTGSVDASDISKKIFQILDSVKEQGLDSREFSIEMDVGSNGSQFTQKFSSVFNSMNEQGLKAKEVELELSTRTVRDASQAMQKYLQW